MYFGSVKFFKHLIYTIVIALIVISAGLAVFFGIKYYQASKALGNSPQGYVQIDNNTINIPDGMSLEQIYLVLSAKGYTPEDILMFLAENETDNVNSFIAKYSGGKLDSDFANADGTETSVDSAAPDQRPIIDDPNAPEYTRLFPELYADATDESASVTKDKVVYLTFDDGPSQRTLEILDILDKYDIKATFFMSGGKSDETAEIMREVAQRGHTLAVHSLSHKYDEVYESVESWLEDFNNTYMSIYDATGVRPQLYRFPGGSVNNYNSHIVEQIIAECTRRGFVYHDWNVSGEDATKSATWSSIYDNVVSGTLNSSSSRAIVLLHDNKDKSNTVNTLDDIIHELRDNDYTFEALDNTIKPITFSH